MVGFFQRFFLAVLVGILALSATFVHAFKMESRSINLPDTVGEATPFTISFQQTYDVIPLVFAIASEQGGQPATVRISGVTVDEFQVAPYEPPDLDGDHAAMTIHYFAIEPGIHTLADGSQIEAATLLTSNVINTGGSNTVTFGTSFASTPAVIASLQTLNNNPTARPDTALAPWLTPLVINSNASQTTLALERSEVSDGVVSTNETIGYVAFLAGSGVSGSFMDRLGSNIIFDVIKTGNVIDGWNDGCDNVAFPSVNSNQRLVIASKSTRNDGDGGWLRRCALNNTSVGLTIDEDQGSGPDQDNERNHPVESADIVVFSQGFVFDSNFVPPTVGSDFKIEAGEVLLPTPASFETVTFQQTYAAPPAVFVLPDTANPDPTAVRIRNVTTSSFEMAAIESPTPAQGDVTTTVHYLAVDKGVHQFPDGTNMVVADVSTSAVQHGNGVAGAESFDNVLFPSPLTAIPAVLTQIQDIANGAGNPTAPWLTTAIQSNSISTGGFNVALQRSEVNDGNVSVAETVSYLAIEPGVITGFLDSMNNPVLLEALRTADNITGFTTNPASCANNNFGQTYPVPPLVIGAINSLDGGDGGWLRRCQVTTSGVRLLIDEDQDQNSERNHTTERAGLMVFSGEFAVDFGRPIADWRFDEGSWNGTANEIADSSGNGYNGTANNATTTAGVLCRAGDLTTSSANDFLSMDSRALNGLTDFTLVAWGRTSAALNGFQAIVSGAAGNTGIEANELVMLFDTANRFTPVISATLFNDTPDIAVAPAPNNDAWHQFTWVRTAATRESCFYLDGVLQGCITNPNADDSDPLNIVPGGLIIGQDQDSVGGGFSAAQDWEGLLDEMLVFDRVLDVTEIQSARNNILAGNNWDGTARVCPVPPLDHYSISHDTTGVTCLTELVTISGHDDSEGLLDVGGNTITLSTSTGRGNWVGVETGAGTFDGSAGGGAATYTFATGETQVTLRLNYTDLAGAGSEIISINVSDGSVTETSGNAVAQDDPDITFSLVGLSLSTIPTQIAGKSSDINPGASTLTLQAVRASDNDPSVCDPLLMNQSTEIEFGAECRNPTNCAGRQLNVSGTDVATNNDDGNASTTTSYTPVTLAFNGSGDASFVVNYPDAGQMQLHARFNLPLDDDLSTPSGDFAVGASNDFIVRPFGLGFSRIENAGGTSNGGGDETGGSGFTAAGEMFTVEVGAYLYEAADDTNADGQPDASADITDNGLTPNYRDDVALSLLAGSTTPTATGSVVGSLAGDTNIPAADFVNGLVNTQISYSEVGSMRLQADATNYLGGMAIDLQALSSRVGRFYPDHFSLNSSTITPACGAFTYMSQPFSMYEYTLEARAVGGALTQNYDDDTLNYDNTASVRLFAENADDGNNLGGRLNEGVSTDWDNGRYVVDSSMALFARDAGVDGALQSLQISIDIDTANEADGRDFQTIAFNQNPSSSGDCIALANCNSVAISGALDLRYGRLVLFDTFGPEDQDLSMSLQVEYFDGTNFILNTDDNCTQYINTEASAAPTMVDAPTGLTSVINGRSNQFSPLVIRALGSPGTVTVTYDAPPWLEPDPTAQAIFGRFRGHDRIIYWQGL